MTAFKRGDRVIYVGGDEALLGETGTVLRSTDRGQVSVQLDMGDYLGTSITAVSTTVPSNAVARAQGVVTDRGSSQDALRGALRLLLAHIEYEGSDL